MALKDILLIMLLVCIVICAISLIFYTIYTYKNKAVREKEKQMIKQQAIQEYIKEMNRDD